MCQPVHFGSSTLAKSSTRASTAPSICSTSPAIGSIRSQLTRLGAYCALASATSAARTASVNSLFCLRSVAVSASTYARYDATAAVTSLSALWVPRSEPDSPEPEPPEPEPAEPVPPSERTVPPSSEQPASRPSGTASARAASDRRTEAPSDDDLGEPYLSG